MNNEFKDKIKTRIARDQYKKVLIHSDLLFGFKVNFVNQKQFLDDHYIELKSVLGDAQIIMPSFNYDFCRGTTFNPIHDPSQVGVFSEYFRRNISNWRSDVPVFSFSGTEQCFAETSTKVIDPFDESSIFGILRKQNGLLMHYGSGFHTTTIIHHVERIFGELIYRYDKYFSGNVVYPDGSTKFIQLKYHVRPNSMNLEYDWTRLENDLIEASIIEKFKFGRTSIILADINHLVSFWLRKIKEDCFYFLNTKTRALVEKKYLELKRPFLLEDFE